MAKPKLPKRFQPYADQAQTETAIRYGAQEAAFKSIFDQLTRDSQRSAQSQDTAYRSLLGSLQAAPADLTRVYSDAGLSPQVLATIGNSPTGQRLAGELARGQAGILQQQTGAQAGAAYQQQHIADQYRDDVGKLNDQATALATEKGLYQSSLLDQLIGTDRKTRHDANVEADKQQFTADENLLDRQASTGNALIGQGIDPATGQPIPGAKGNKPKAKPRVTPHEQSLAAGDFTNALGNAQAMLDGENITPGLAREVLKRLTSGRPATSGKPGKPVYEEVDVKDSTGKVVGKKRQPKLDPRTGTVVTAGETPGTPAVDPVDPAIAQAAIDMATRGYLTPSTVKELHRIGLQVRGLPNIKTWSDRDRPGRGGVQAPTSKQAPGANGQNRPT